MSGWLLEMREVVKRYPGVLALDHARLCVRPGSVHALMGENGAGKSTLMKCLYGLCRPDGGDIIIAGTRHAAIAGPRAAMDLGVSMIQQELHPVRLRSVMENVWLGRFPARCGVVDHARMRRDTQELFARLGLGIDPDVPAGSLSASYLQLLEIARAVSCEARIIIMDEPTSSLTGHEAEQLFGIIARLRGEGRSIIYISHKMEEILAISDEVTVMRDGRHVGTWPAGELSRDFLIRQMVGRELSGLFPPRGAAPGAEAERVLEVSNLTSAVPGSFAGVSFELRRGEILGIGGLVGAQRTELVESMFGLRPLAGGTLSRGGRELRITSPRDAMRQGLALLTEDRRHSGIFAILSILDNALIAAQRRFARLGVLQGAARSQAGQRACEALRVRMASLHSPIASLSGGNQQKVLIARWLLTDCDILIFDEPTRGIDVGAKYEIYTLMQQQVRDGKSIIMISSEMPELLGMADRIMVMCEGRVSGFVERGHFDQEEIMRLASDFA